MPTQDVPIELPFESNPWLFRSTFALLVLAPLVELAGFAVAVAVITAAYLTTLLCPVGIRISVRDRTLTYLYSRLNPFKKTHVVPLSGFTRIYTEVFGYGGRALHMSGTRGEHIVLAKFHQNIFAPRKHLEDVTVLRKQIAETLGVNDGGDV